MFRVCNLKLHNICQYADVDIPIEIGLTAVCGRNGNGKTNLLRALVYGLTGLVDGSWGSQQTLQKDGASDPGYVVVSLSDGTRLLEIQRYSMSGPKYADSITECIEDKRKTIVTRRREVDAYLADVFGINVSLLFQICWGRQNQLASLLTAPAAFISSFLSSVFDTKYLETVREKLKIALGTIVIYDMNLEDHLAENEKKLAELQDSNQLEEALRASTAHMSELSQKLSDLRSRLGQRQSTEEWDRHDAELRKAMEGCAAVLVEFEGPDGLQPTDELIALREEIRQSERTAQHALEQVAVKLYQVEADKRTTESALDDLSVVDNTLEQLLADTHTCQFCGAVVNSVESYRQKVCEALTGEHGEEEYHKKSASDRHSSEARLSLLTEQEATLTAQRKAREEELHKLVELEQTTNEQITLARKRDTRDTTKQRLAWLQKEREALDAEQPLTKKEEEELAKLEASVYSCSQATEQLRMAVVQTATERTFLQDMIEKQRRQVDEASVNNEARRVLNCLRDMLSQNRAQARYLASKIAEINVRLATFMEATDMPFSLRLNPDTHLFEYTTAAGHVHPAGHLSGAQLNISAVVLQMAIFEVVQPQINLFLVDEPSEALDDQNKMMMAALFQRMNTLLPAIAGTMLIVSRDWQLIDSCGNVINVNEA